MARSSHRVCSLANASLDIYPNNTLTKFTHRLPSAINLKKGLYHSIKLISIGIYNELKESLTYHSNYINVHLAQLNPKYTTNSVYRQCLAKVPFTAKKPREEGKIIWFHFDTPIDHSLNGLNIVEELSYYITDCENKQLQLKEGPITVINVVIEEMEFPDQFSLDLSPTHSNDKYPNNTPHSFIVSLPHEIKLDNSWEVALHHIISPSPVEIQAKVVLRISGDQHKTSFSTPLLMSKPQKAHISAKNIIRDINRELILYGKIKRYKRELTFHCQDFLLDKNPTLLLNEVAALLLGIPFTTDDEFMELPILQKRQLLSEDFSSHNRFAITHLLLYCDIVKDSIVGNVLANILEVIPVEALGSPSTNAAHLYILPRVTWKPFSKNVINSITMHISSIAGNSTTFKSGGDTCYTLLFRKR